MQPSKRHRLDDALQSWTRRHEPTLEELLYHPQYYRSILAAMDIIPITVRMMGPPGSGKSTVARRLKSDVEARGFTCEIHSTDDYFNENGNYCFQKELLSIYHAKNKRAIERSSAHVIIEDNTNLHLRNHESLSTPERLHVVLMTQKRTLEDLLKSNTHYVPEALLRKFYEEYVSQILTPKCFAYVAKRDTIPTWCLNYLHRDDRKIPELQCPYWQPSKCERWQQDHREELIRNARFEKKESRRRHQFNNMPIHFNAITTDSPEVREYISNPGMLDARVVGSFTFRFAIQDQVNDEDCKSLIVRDRECDYRCFVWSEAEVDLTTEEYMETEDREPFTLVCKFLPIF